MNTYKFANNMFYPYTLEDDYKSAGTWPDDGCDVTDDIYSEFTGEPPPGKIRITGEDGMPAWGDIPPPTQADIIEQASITKQQLIDDANDHMNGKQWPGKAAIGRLKGDDLAQYNLWLDYLDALELVDATNAPDIEWPTKPE